MAKKSRRARQRPSTVAQPIRVPQAVRPVAPETKAKAKEVDFAKEYHYVIEDLKRIGLIAATLLALLVALALVIG